MPAAAVFFTQISAHPESPVVPSYSAERFFDYLRPDRCCLCFAREAALPARLRSLLDEYVNDPGVRRRLLEDRGFCRRHAWMAVSTRNSLAVGLLYLAWLEKGVAEKPRLFRIRARRRGDCFLCEWEREQDRTNARQFAGAFGQSPKLREAFREHGVLCLDHRDACREAPLGGAVRQKLEEACRAALERHAADLRRFLESYDYRRGGGPEVSEWDAWVRAVRLVSGERGDG